MITVRSLAFNGAFYVWTAFMCILYIPAFALPRMIMVRGQERWAIGVNWLMKRLAGIDVEIRGREHLPPGACIVASKHQSAWDTLIWHQVLNDPAVIIKKELTYIPVYGWICQKTKMIAVDRSGGTKALRGMLKAAREARDTGRQVTIFPEGTRSAPGETNPYQSGIAAVYGDLDVPVIPVAVNSGLFWPRRRFMRQPGTIVLEFLKPIAPGLKRKPFMAQLEREIETAAKRLVTEGRQEILGDKPVKESR